MKKKNSPKAEAQKTLNVLDNLQRVEVNPEFLKRVQSSVASTAQNQAKVISINNLLKVAAVGVLLLLNIFTLNKSLSTTDHPSTLSEILSEEYSFYNASAPFYKNQ